jgi:hypothetical protein
MSFAIRKIINVPVQRWITGSQPEHANLYVRRSTAADVRVALAAYNARMPAQDAGLAVTRDQIEARIDRDNGSILLAFIEGQEERGPLGIINVVKLQLSALGQLPTTHAELTGDDTWSTTEPLNGNTWICPWGTASGEEWAKGWITDLHGRTVSAAQLVVRAVMEDAKQSGKRLLAQVAFTRPIQLLKHLSDLTLPVYVQFENEAIVFFGEGRMEPRIDGIYCYPMSNYRGEGMERFATTATRVLSMEEYIGRAVRGEKGADFILSLHASNGASFPLELVRPMGHPGDQSAMGYRTPAVYPFI